MFVPGVTILLVCTKSTLGLWIRKAVEGIKQESMGHTSRSIKDNVAESNLDYDDLT